LTIRIILPDGYRLLVTAPDVRVLVNTRPSCQVVARYRGGSAPGRVERDAWEHAGRSGHRALRPGDRTLGRPRPSVLPSILAAMPVMCGAAKLLPVAGIEPLSTHATRP